MKSARGDRETGLGQMLLGALAAAALTLGARYLILNPLLGAETGNTVAPILLMFLLGYFAFATAPLGQYPLPLWHLRRLYSGVVGAVVWSVVTVGLDKIWP